MEDKITIPITKELRERLKEKLKETNFKSIQEYILYILEQMVSETEVKMNSEREKSNTGDEGETDIKKGESYTKEDEAALKKNLEELGYL